MKKIYILIVLITPIASTLCMEKERKILFPENGYYQATNVQITNPIPSLQNSTCMCTANEPGWEQLNDIANITYKNNQYAIQNPTDLKPIYKKVSTKKTIKRDEKVGLLEPIMQPDDKCIKQLLSDAYDFAYSHHSEGHSIDTFLQDEKLISLIESIQFERSNGIHEDLLAELAYQEEHQLDTVNEYMALVFNCIKQYNLTIKKAQEAGPNTFALDFIDTQGTAYIHLADCLQKLFCVNIDDIYAFTNPVYDKKMTYFPNAYTNSYKNLTNEFYEKAYDLLISKKFFTTKKNTDIIQELLHMVNQAKKRKDINNETDLINKILDFEQPATLSSTFIDFIDTHYPIKYSTKNTKNRIALFCVLVETYNRARGNKQTPTSCQYSCYRLQRYLDLALLDNVNKDQFDPNLYAFTEFKTLRNKTKKLIKADDQVVQQNINNIKK